MSIMQQSYRSICTVCGQSPQDPHEYGGRNYCETHVRRFYRDNPPLWKASSLSFGVIILMVIGVGILNLVISQDLQGGLSLTINLGIAILPGISWLIFLYQYSTRQDAPFSPLIPTLFILSALTAAAITRPLLLDFLNLNQWLSQLNAFNRFISQILIGGSVHAFILYAAVRYSVWRTPTFERRVDGVAFSLAAGWGYAATMTAMVIIEQGGLSLLNGNLRTISQMCSYLAPSIIIGYFLGRNRFEDMPAYYIPLGFILAAFIHGLMLYALSQLNVSRLRITTDAFTPWPGLIVSGLLLTIVYLAILGLLRRHNSLSKAHVESEI